MANARVRRMQTTLEERVISVLQTETVGVSQSSRRVDSLLSHPAQSQLVLRSGDDLFSMDERFLSALCEVKGFLDVDDARVCRPLAAGVERGEQFHAGGRGLHFIQRGVIELIDLSAISAARRITVSALNETLENAAFSDDGENLLCIWRDNAEHGLAEYRVRRAARNGQSLAGDPLLRTSIQPYVAWCAAASAFIVFDPCGERAWRVAADARAAHQLDLSRGRGRSIAALICHPSEPWIAMRLEDHSDGSTHLIQGWMTTNAVEWGTTARLPGGMIDHLRWRPASRDLAYVRSRHRTAFLECIEPLSAAVKSCELPRGWFVSDLQWSGDGERVYAASGTHLGAWRPER